jgi:hypothetical protein
VSVRANPEGDVIINGCLRRGTECETRLDLPHMRLEVGAKAVRRLWPRWLDAQPVHRWLRENVERTARSRHLSKEGDR